MRTGGKTGERFPALETRFGRAGLVEILNDVKSGKIELDLHDGWGWGGRNDFVPDDETSESPAASDGVATIRQKHVAQYVKEFEYFDGSISFVNMDLSRSAFLGSKMRKTNLEGASLRDSDFRWSDLRESNLRGADMRKLVMYGSDISGCDLSGSILIGADLRGIRARRTKFNGAILYGCNLAGADLRDAQFGGAKFGETKFSHKTDFSFAHVTSSNFFEVNFGDANYYKATVVGAKDQKWPSYPPAENEHLFRLKLRWVKRLRIHPGLLHTALFLHLIPMVLV
jgi:hypothetical protein